MRIETHEFDSARTLVDQLQLTGQLWYDRSNLKTEWLFRGQGNAVWPLQPSAWREDGIALLTRYRPEFVEWVDAQLKEWAPIDLYQRRPLPPSDKARAREVLLQTWSELRVVQDFTEGCDSVGHSVPMADHSTWWEFLKLRTEPDPDKIASWILGPTFNELASLQPTIAFALAQHHGLPTRLLDWTQQPLVAAYFAAEQAWSHRDGAKPPTHLAVWALNAGSRFFDSKLSILRYPRAQLPYLHAQHGVFLWHREATSHYMEHESWPDYGECLSSPDWGQQCLRKLTLPVAEIPEMFDLLHVSRMSRAHLMPTFDNVVATMKARWERSPSLA